MRVLIIFVALLFSSSGFSQNKFGAWNASLGATHSVWRWVHKRPFKEFDTNWQFTVGSQFNLDFGILRRFSAGFGVVYHVHHLNIENYQFSQNGQVYYESPRQTIRAFGGYFRALIHMLSIYEETDEEVDFYYGFGKQLMQYKTSNNSNDPNFFTDNEDYPDYFYAVAGIRYYPTEWFGIHGEIAIPGPYTISLGTTFRFGGDNF